MDRIQETLHVSQADAAVLAAVNLADELLKTKQRQRICAGK